MKSLHHAGRTVCIVLALALLGASAPLPYPAAPPGNVTDSYFGTTVADPYRWLEDPASPKTRAWASAETQLARTYLRSRPAHAFYAGRVARLSRTSTARFNLQIAGKRLVYLRQTPPQAQAQLVTRDGLGGSELVLFDPVEAGATPPAIESMYLSPDGSKVAFTTQIAGAENETLHVVDTATGTMEGDTIPDVGGGTSPTALVWDGDGKGFTHTRFPRNADGSRANSGILLYHHTLGTGPDTDAYVFGKGLSPKAEYVLLGSHDGSQQAIFETDGDGVHGSWYLRGADNNFARIATPADGIGSSSSTDGTFVGNELFVISKSRDSRGRIVAIGPGKTFANGNIVVPASSVVVQQVVEVPGGFVTADIDGGDAKARYFDSRARLRAHLPIPAQSVITELAADPAGGTIVVGYQDYATPGRWLAYDPRTNRLNATGIARTAPGDYSNVVVERAYVPSLDGKAKIPVEIVRLKTTRRGPSTPTILYAYGAYGVVTTPFFIGSTLAWLERGGVFAQAMVRGGGEYGDAWHNAARLSTKTVSSDDLAACATWLGSHGYGDAKHLGINGGSAGGFLMGLALTRNPGSYRAVIGQVGIYDLLRVELTPNGAYNTPEFGTVKDPRQFVWMRKQSPYHNVVKGRPYPAVLLTTGENDPRVDPYNSRKMAARLQAASSSGYPVLLLQQSGEGHGIGNSFQQRIDDNVNRLTFFDSQLR